MKLKLKAKLKRHADDVSTYVPKSPEDGAKWWNEQVRKKKIVFWDGDANHMIATSDPDLRHLPCKDLSNCVRIYSEDNIINFLKGKWESTPTHIGKVAKDLRKMIVVVGPRNRALASRTKEVLNKIENKK